MNYIEACNAIAVDFGLDPQLMVKYALEDEIGGFGYYSHWPGGSVWATEGRMLYALIRCLRPRHLLEVGTAAGCSATHMLYGIQQNANNDHLTSVDVEADGYMVPDGLRRWWTMHTGVTGQEFLKKHADMPFDFAYEDAAHSLEATQEIIAAMKAIPTVRWIISHDVHHPYVGADVKTAWNNVFGGAWRAYIAEPSDCGLAIWKRPSERILYLPLLAPDAATHAMQAANKKGLFDALAEYGSITQLDYMLYSPADLIGKVKELVQDLRPTLLFTQLHGPGHLTPEQLGELRGLAPDMTTVNWSGDAWKHSLISDGMIALGKAFDLNLTTVPEALPIYAERGVRAHFFQLAYERPQRPVTVPGYDIVFLANAYTEGRKRLMTYLRGCGLGTTGIYGDWAGADGTNVYDFGAGEALYQQAKVAIADNVWFEKKADLFQYVSDRPFQALMAGGAVLMHQHVPLMYDLSGLVAGTHYVEWRDLRDLDGRLRYYLDPKHEDERRQIVECGQQFARERHTWRERVKDLMWSWLPEVRGRR